MANKYTTPLSPAGEQPVDFYSWGDQSASGIISKREQINEKLEEAFDSISIEEDKETPETDYVLKVLGKEAGRVVVPFDMVVKDAYYDKETKEIVIIVFIGEGEEKEIRFSVEDLIDTYTGDETTIHVENNIISITKEVMDKFDDLRKSIDYEKNYRKEGDEKLKQELAQEIADRESADSELSKAISEISTDIEVKIDEKIAIESQAREEADANLTQFITNVNTNLEGAVQNLSANDASLEAQINAEKNARETADIELNNAIANISSDIDEKIAAESQARETADNDLQSQITKEIADRKEANTDIIKDYSTKIDTVQNNLMELSNAHIASVTKLQDTDNELHQEIMNLAKECDEKYLKQVDFIPLSDIRALFTTNETSQTYSAGSVEVNEPLNEKNVEPSIWKKFKNMF